MLRMLDLFSGIGGFSYAGEKLVGGYETVAFCEYDKHAQKVLRKHWPDTEIIDDVRDLANDADRFRGMVDIICGGYPCQPFSYAGVRKGDQDDRHLWPAMLAIIKKVRPTWVIGENVAGHISMGLDDVLSDLEGQGYTCRSFVIPACAVDAPHRRDRVWTVAHRSQLQRDGSGEHRQPRQRQVSQSGKRGGAEFVADADDAGLQGRSQARDVRGERTRINEQFERCADLPRAAWLPEPDVGRVANGISRRVDRLKALGNAVVPQIPEMIGYAILEAEKERP